MILSDFEISNLLLLLMIEFRYILLILLMLSIRLSWLSWSNRTFSMKTILIILGVYHTLLILQLSTLLRYNLSKWTWIRGWVRLWILIRLTIGVIFNLILAWYIVANGIVTMLILTLISLFRIFISIAYYPIYVLLLSSNIIIRWIFIFNTLFFIIILI